MTDDAETIRALKSVDAYRDQVDRIREELGAAPDEPAVYAAKALRKRAERVEAQLEALRADCIMAIIMAIILVVVVLVELTEGSGG